MNINELKGKTVALASSGGLDSCTVTKWLVDHDVTVISMTADLGQPDEIDMDIIKERMFACGAKDAILIDLKSSLSQTAFELIQAKASYEGGYWNTTGIARHVTVEGLIQAMKERDIKILVHGATGRGNDQVRFSLVANMLDPSIEVYAPWRDDIFIEEFGGRIEMIDYCEKHKLPITATKEKPYSTDANILGLTHEAGKLEYLDTPADFITPGMGVFPQDAPDEALEVTIEFKKGIPVSINGVSLKPEQLLLEANQIAGCHAVGIGIHTIENRFVGIKSRGIYESPALCLLSQCYEFLLEQILDRKARRFYEKVCQELAEQIYQGYYFDLTSQMILSSLKPVNEIASGIIRVKLYKGNISFVEASDCENSLYDPELSSMEDVGDFNHADSEGFIRVLGVNAKAISAKGQVARIKNV